jgi:hypothetical protein
MNNFEQLPLKDIHLPDPVSWWPLAVGWWMLILLCVLATAGFLWWLRVSAPKRRRGKIRKLVRDELGRLEAEYKVSNDAGRLLQDVSILIRRLAMSLSPRGQVAGLCGQDWADWLRRQGLDEQSLTMLLEGPYTRVAPSDVTTLTGQCRQMLRKAGSMEPTA